MEVWTPGLRGGTPPTNRVQECVSSHRIQNKPYREGIHLDQGRKYIYARETITKQTCSVFNHFKNNPIITVLTTFYYKYGHNFNQTQ